MRFGEDLTSAEGATRAVICAIARLHVYTKSDLRSDRRICIPLRHRPRALPLGPWRHRERTWRCHPGLYWMPPGGIRSCPPAQRASVLVLATYYTTTTEILDMSVDMTLTQKLSFATRCCTVTAGEKHTEEHANASMWCSSITSQFFALTL